LRRVRKGPVALGFVAAALLVAAAPARAEDPDPAGVPELLGARGIGMSAYRGVAAGNDGLFTNAASLAARRRYTIETQWSLGRRGADTNFQAYTASVVDSAMESTTGGFAYTRVPSGPWQGSLYHAAFAFPLTQSFYLGGTGKYLSLNGPQNDELRAGNVDASAFWQAGSLFSVGVSGYNLIAAGHKHIQPRGLGVGAAIGDERRFNLAADWRADFDRQGKLTNLYSLGGEVLLADLFPVRGGYLHDETRNASAWSAGIGFVSTSGIAVDLAYRQGIERSDDRTLAVSLKLFLFSQ
jgi:opacity protein-like surface antigen